MKGTYILVLILDKDSTIKVGALKEVEFRKGYYAYVGSGMGTKGSSSLESRVKRHFSSNKKFHWHIDYFLNCKSTIIIRLYLIPCIYRLECIIAKDLLNCSDSYIKGFGSSDCSCKSHLFYFKDITRVFV